MTIWSCIGALRKKVLFLIGGWFVNSALLFKLYSKRSAVRDRVATSDTDLCVEGFQRSGNSYFFMCLSISNPNLVIAHHIHGIAHIMSAIKLGVPCIVLIREPASSIASLLTWDSRLGVDMAIKSYIKYYERLITLPNTVFFANFEDLIQDVNKVILAFNSRNQLRLREFIVSEEELKSIMLERQSKYANKASAPFPHKTKNTSNARNKEVVTAHNDFLKAQNCFSAVKDRVSY